MIKLSTIKKNPANPRQIRDEKFTKLKTSITAFPQMMTLRPMIVDADNVLLGGNMRYAALKSLGYKEVPDDWVKRADELTEEQKAEFVIKDNVGFGEWDWDALSSWDDEALAAWGLDVPGFEDVTEPLEEDEAAASEAINKAAELQQKWQTATGQLWKLGEHRLICGDCTDKAVVERVMQGEKAVLVCADPPYGMGKENEGVANDNLYAEKLDKFQMAWWTMARPYIEDNGSAYIWGNAEDLWRLWYRGGLKDSERVTFRSNIIWNKPPSASAWGSPIGSDVMRSYPHGYEVCLFFMLGEQGFNNNADNYWEGFEPIRLYLQTERDKAGWNNKTVADFFGFHARMADHWFSKSQWSFPTCDQYKRLQAEAKGNAFKREHDELKRSHDELKRSHDELKQEFYATRAYFDNTHDNMTDVWEFPRVTGEDRHEHATPKPIAMICRAVKSSAAEGGVVYEPFLGSGTTLIACEQLNRKCRAIEISDAYVAVCLERWSNLTGKTPELIEQAEAVTTAT